ncbi:MAG: hypothetical protein JWP25_6098 [Bradyrhizobium sp.]|nr:hypothetical protein [Bradyrhizobium sp.]
MMLCAADSSLALRRNKIEASQSTQCFHQRPHRPVSCHRADASNKLVASVLGRPDCFEVVLKDNLMRGLIKGLAREPGAASLGPMLASLVGTTVAQEECQQMPTIAAEPAFSACRDAAPSLARRLDYAGDWRRLLRAPKDIRI